jgi:cytoskeletal protein RodZ
MPLNMTASFVHNEVSYHINAESVGELVTSVAAIKGGAAPAANTPAPAPETKPGKKSASTDKPAASSPPADSTKEASAASAPTPASSSPAAAPAAAEVTYEKSGIPEKIAGYLGAKESGGYADRRAAMVALLTQFKVKTGKELTAAQFGEFDAALTKLAAPAEEDLG